MIKSFFSKWFKINDSNKLKVPKEFATKKRSIFFNRYGAFIYALIAWHCFGYFIMSASKKMAEKEGIF
jgi:hypothetical protein